MHVDFSYAHFEWSFCAIYHYFHNQNIRFVEHGAWKKVALLFNGATRRSIVCMLILCRYFNAMQWSAIGLSTKSAVFFFCIWVHKFRDFTVQRLYRQWITTKNVRKKILHALRLKWTILIIYFSSYIKGLDGNLRFWFSVC